MKAQACLSDTFGRLIRTSVQKQRNGRAYTPSHRPCGENALAAVGNSYEVTLIFIAFAFGANIGCSVVISRFFGAKDYKSVKTAVYTTFIAGGILCAVLMILGLLFNSAMLELIHTSAEIFADSYLYLKIYIWGLPFLFFYNIATGIFSALGDSKTPFIFLAISSSANIAVDILTDRSQ